MTDDPGYIVEFALRVGEPDWQLYTRTDNLGHAIDMAVEASDDGGYRARVVDEVDERVIDEIVDERRAAR